MEQTTEFREITANSESQQPGLSFLLTFIRAPLKTVLFRDGGVSRVLKSSCIRPYTPVFRARLPCPHKKCLVFRGAHNMLPALCDNFSGSESYTSVERGFTDRGFYRRHPLDAEPNLPTDCMSLHIL